MSDCLECGFVYDESNPARSIERLTAAGECYSQRLRHVGAEPDGADVVRIRPAPQTWSGLEYACHARDVLLVQRERLFLTLVEDCPSFAPMYREQRVRLARYLAEDPGPVADQLQAATTLTVWAFSAVDEPSWVRPCVYNFPAPTVRTIAWLASQTLHEVEHHLADFEHVVAKAREHRAGWSR